MLNYNRYHVFSFPTATEAAENETLDYRAIELQNCLNGELLSRIPKYPSISSLSDIIKHLISNGNDSIIIEDSSNSYKTKDLIENIKSNYLLCLKSNIIHGDRVAVTIKSAKDIIKVFSLVFLGAIPLITDSTSEIADCKCFPSEEIITTETSGIELQECVPTDLAISFVIENQIYSFSHSAIIAAVASIYSTNYVFSREVFLITDQTPLHFILLLLTLLEGGRVNFGSVSDMKIVNPSIIILNGKQVEQISTDVLNSAKKQGPFHRFMFDVGIRLLAQTDEVQADPPWVYSYFDEYRKVIGNRLKLVLCPNRISERSHDIMRSVLRCNVLVCLTAPPVLGIISTQRVGDTTYFNYGAQSITLDIKLCDGTDTTKKVIDDDTGELFVKGTNTCSEGWVDTGLFVHFSQYGVFKKGKK